MTEQEWLGRATPAAMVEFLGRTGSKRKLRLFAVACARRLDHLLADPRSRRAVDVAERYADRGRKGPPSRKELRQAELEAWAVAHALNRGPDHARWNAAQAATEAASPTALGAARRTAAHAEFSATGRGAQERAAQAGLLRCVFGNPFRPVTLDPAWRAPDVLSLARAAYEERTLPAGTLEPARLALLADALEDAGCDNADLLNHLRRPGTHVRGCWAVDLCLGRE